MLHKIKQLFILASLIAIASCGGGGGGGGTTGGILSNSNFYSVIGTTTGLPAGMNITISINGTEDLVLTNNGAFKFSKQIENNSNYYITIKNQSSGINCQISNNSGIIQNSDTPNILITCVLSSASFFEKNGISLPNPIEYLPTCNGGIFLGPLTTIQVSSDKRKAIFAHYWCFNTNYPLNYFGQTPNSLVVYLPNSDGSYRIGNTELFNTKLIDLGGASRKARIADFNNDGYLDIAFSINKEDGRPMSNNNWNAKIAVVMSNGNNTYRIDYIGEPNYNHNIGIGQYAKNGFEVFSTGNKSYQFNNYAWKTVDRYPNLGMWSSLALPLENSETQTTKIFDAGFDNYLRLYKNDGNQWPVKSTIENPIYKTIKAIHMNGGAPIDTPIYSINNQLYGFAAFPESCTIKISPNDSTTIVTLLDGRLIPSNYSEPLIETSAIAQKPLLAYNTFGDLLSLIPNFIKNQTPSNHSYWYECKDINNDGFDDIVVSRENNLPVAIYLNNKNGTLAEYSIAGIPIPPSEYPKNSTISKIDDLNGDGISDIIYHTNNGPIRADGINLSNHIIIYKGIKDITLP